MKENTKKRKPYFIRVFIGLDQLANAIAGGNPDATISARIGWNSNYGETNQNFWAIMELIVDWTFSPIDGEKHCLVSYESDKGETHYAAGNTYIKVFLMCLALMFCIPFSVLVRLYVLFLKLFK